MTRLAQITVELTDARIRKAVLGPVHTQNLSALSRPLLEDLGDVL